MFKRLLRWWRRLRKRCISCGGRLERRSLSEISEEEFATLHEDQPHVIRYTVCTKCDARYVRYVIFNVYSGRVPGA